MTSTALRAAAPTAALLGILLTGCSGGGDSGGSGGGSSDSVAGFSGTTAQEAPHAAGAAGERVVTEDAGEVEPAGTHQALIRKGSVALRADDVGAAQRRVQEVVDRYAGEVTEERTTSDDDGRPAYTRMVLRVPSGDFDEAMAALKEVAELDTANTSEEDVTTQLIDTRTRVRVQQRSIARISTLLDRAQSIRDIMAIEAQLSRRQATLESLQRQLAYLTGQTTLSTITVTVDQTPQAAPAEEDDAGFLHGLAAGWNGLAATAVALATVAGALLPWLAVTLVLGVPLWLVVRAARRRQVTAPTSPPATE